jgi:hypothetical protein
MFLLSLDSGLTIKKPYLDSIKHFLNAGVGTHESNNPKITTDKFNNLVEFLDGSEFNMVFSIETENIVLTSENINKNNIDNLKYS